MTSARMSTLAPLRGDIDRIEAHGDVHALKRVALGHADADAMLRGGLAMAAVHEVFAEGHQSAVATGFIAGLAGRISARRPLVWVRQDFSEIESGALSMNGLSELGLDPRCLVMVRAADGESALRSAADALACDALGAVVLEVWGETRQLDLVASRKLTLSAHRGAHGERPYSMSNSSATVMARLGDGSWNGIAMKSFSDNRRRILSLWLPRLPIDRIKRQLAREAFSSEV